MYRTSPMERYNKNNPFIIIAKKMYDKITDEIQLFSKDFISNIIFNGAIFMFLVLFNFLNFSIIPTILISILLLFYIGSIILYRVNVKYFLISHFAMQEFNRLSELEVNSILALNNEDILKCINGLYQLYGELSATRKYLNIFSNIISILEFILLGYNLIIIFI